MVRTALGSDMLGAGGVSRRVVAVAADAAEIDDGHGAKRHEDQRKLLPSGSHACLHAAPLSGPKNSFAEPHLRPSACGNRTLHANASERSHT